ncbi:NADH dehydrogenase [ubiquinone] 1 beta subcomplex subunit 5, mitochondrial, partial [Trichinella sp. T6]
LFISLVNFIRRIKLKFVIAMTVLSKIVALNKLACLSSLKLTFYDNKRNSHERVFMLRPGKLRWYRFKDIVHFYFFIGSVFFLGIATYVNLMYGSCEFRDTPEGYEPHFWEYEKHPISQFFMRYFTVNPQKMYEKRLAKIGIEMQKRRWILEEKRVKHLMFERADYKAWYYIPMKAKWTERNRWHFDRYRDNVEHFQHVI